MHMIQQPFSIVIPVYNESENIAALSHEILHLLSDKISQYEIIFVNDGSQDNTNAVLEELQQKFPNIYYVTHVTNYGQSAALISGIKAARFRWIITLDGDGQNDPADIQRLFEKLAATEKHSVVLGNRIRRKDHWIRRISSRIGNATRQMLLKDNCSDTGCSLKLFPKEAFLELPHFNHLHRFLPALFKRAGFETINLPVNHRPRLHGVSKYGIKNRLWTGIVDLLGVWWLIHRPCHPMITRRESASDE